MKKKILIISVIIIFIFILYIFKNKSKLSIITLDINPSIRLSVNKNNKVVKIIALNEDAKDIVDNKLKNKSLDDALQIITDKIIDNVDRTNNKYVILINSEGDIKNIDVERKINKFFSERNTEVEVISIDNITTEDEKVAKEYNITPSKAAYINSIKKENNDIDIEVIVDKSVSELKETKETGYYCDEGYILEGDSCLKEIRRDKKIEEYGCASGYSEIDGKCYEAIDSIEIKSTTCQKEFIYKDGKCVRTITTEPKYQYKCDNGMLVRKNDYFRYEQTDKYICIDTSNSKKPTLRCLTEPHKIINGECYVGPAPTIGGGCPSPDKLVGGGCYSLDPKDQYVCPDGTIYHKSQNSVPEYCPDTLKYKDATIVSVSCDDGYTKKGNKCMKDEIIDVERKYSCPNGYTLTDNNRCINKNNISDKQKNIFCEDRNARLENDICIVYERSSAKK